MSIPAEAYLEEGWLLREAEAWFASRLFVDLSASLAAEGAWRAFALGCRQYLVRRGAQALDALDNVCLHRSAQLLPNGRGNGALRCAYHGWRYDDSGAIAATPLVDSPCLKRRQLASYPVIDRRGLVWMSPGRQALTAYADDPLLEDWPVAASSSFHRASLDHAANWKLLVENVVEGYHLSFVHPQTFVRAGYPSTAPVRQGLATTGSWALTEPRAAPSRPTPRALEGATPGYRHLYLFPNVFLSLTNGLVLFVSHFHPVSASHTRLEYELLATPLLQHQRPAVVEHVQAEAIEFTERALREDLVLLEASQRGLSATRASHQLQGIEPRIAHFHQHYLAVLQT